MAASRGRVALYHATCHEGSSYEFLHYRLDLFTSDPGGYDTRPAVSIEWQGRTDPSARWDKNEPNRWYAHRVSVPDAQGYYSISVIAPDPEAAQKALVSRFADLITNSRQLTARDYAAALESWLARGQPVRDGWNGNTQAGWTRSAREKANSLSQPRPQPGSREEPETADTDAA